MTKRERSTVELRTSVPRWLYEAIEDDSDRTGATVPETVRRALMHYLDSQVKERP